MSERRIPKRVQIDGKWLDVKEGWAGRLDLVEWMSSAKYTAREPYHHINNLFWVYDADDRKVGEFHTDNRTWSGVVAGFEM